MDWDTAPGAAAWIAHYIEVSAAMLIFGAALFPFYAKKGDQPSDRPASGAALLAAVLCLAAAAATALKIADVTGGPESLLSTAELHDFFFATSFGIIWLLRLVFSALLVTAALIFDERRRMAFHPRLRDATLLLLSALILASFAGSGHASAAAGGGAALAMAWEGAHLLAAGAWIGGLWPLLRSAGRSDGKDGAANIRLLRSFSLMGQLAVAFLLLGGFATLIMLTEAWHATAQALLASDYGWTLIVKHALIAAMLAIAAINRFWLLPRLGGGGTARLSQMRRAILLECALAALAVAAGITLSQSVPPEIS